MVQLPCLLVLTQLSAVYTTSVTNQGNECRWGRSDELFALSEPHNIRGPFTVSVLIDHPPNVVYPLLPSFLRELFNVLKRSVTVYQCHNTPEIYAKMGRHRYLITRERARLYHQSFYKTGIALQTTSKRCVPDEIKCAHEEDLDIMKVAQEVFGTVLRRSTVAAVTPRPSTPSSPRDKWILFFVTVAVIIGGACVCCWGNKKPASDPPPLRFEELSAQNDDQPVPIQQVTNQRVGNRQSPATIANNSETQNAGAITLNCVD